MRFCFSFDHCFELDYCASLHSFGSVYFFIDSFLFFLDTLNYICFLMHFYFFFDLLPIMLALEAFRAWPIRLRSRASARHPSQVIGSGG